jgi:hypothetical protein
MATSKERDEGGIATAKRIMERLVNMPPKPHKDTKADDPPPGKPRRGRPSKSQVGKN